MKVPAAPALDPAERSTLLRIARCAVISAIGGGLDPGPAHPHGALDRPFGAFVSLYCAGSLRGCVGVVRPAVPLFETVRECGGAATRDDRFEALRPSQIEETSIEISVLGVVVPIDAAQVEPGRHGLIITRGPNHGLLLPQVAAREEWDAAAFLDQTCQKAGLAPGAWRSGATIEAFEALVFGDGTRDY